MSEPVVIHDDERTPVQILLAEAAALKGVMHWAPSDNPAPPGLGSYQEDE